MTADPLNVKSPQTDYPLDALIAERWSPRSFDPDAELSQDQLGSLLEAARWAPSCLNTQPWRFIVTRRGTPEFKKVADALTGNNLLWAPKASALLVACAMTQSDDGSALRWARYDTGQAAAQLAVQAESMGLSVHQMAGYDPGAIQRAFSLPDTVEPVAVMAVGYFDPSGELPDPLAEREAAPRTRDPLEQIVLNGWPVS